MQKFLFFLSKTDGGIIGNCSPGVKSIQASLGFFVLLTGILAFISGSYAVSNMFIHEDMVTGKPKMAQGGWVFSIIIGFVYAVFIMAIDREIVSASKKWAVVLRIPLAVIISIIISVPVELQLFEGRINKRLLENLKAENDRLELGLRQKINPLEKRRDTLLQFKNTALKQRMYWGNIMDVEVVGNIRDGKPRPAGKGDAYNSAKENKAQENELINKCDSELVVVQSQIKTMQANMDTALVKGKIPQSYDLLSKYITLNEIKADDKTGAASKMGVGITILFLLFELIPSIMKLLLPPTEYDALLAIRRRLNILAAKKIYLEAREGYNGKTGEEISQNNPEIMQQVFQSQSTV